MTTTSAALERQAETVRADLSATLEDLRGNMTRAALAGGAAALAKEGAAAVARAVTRRASDHPLATLLIGAGLVMLLSNGKANTSVTRILGRVTSEPRGSDGARVAAQQAAGQAMDWAADKTSEAVTSAHSAALAAADVVSTTKDKAGDLVSRGRDQVIGARCRGHRRRIQGSIAPPNEGTAYSCCRPGGWCRRSASGAPPYNRRRAPLPWAVWRARY
jgi:hypothetical protein